MRTFLRSTRRGWTFFHEADKGGGSGNPAPSPATEENEPQPVGNTLEEKLSSATTIIGQLFARAKSVVGLTKERDDAKAEATRLQQQFESATQEATTAKNDLATVKGELATAKATIGTLTSERDNAAANVTRLEGLCGLKGIDPKKVVPPASSAQGEKSDEDIYNEWKSLTGVEKAKFRKANSAALDRHAAAQKKK